MKNKARINYYVDLLTAISFVVAGLTGVVLYFVGSGGYQGGRNPRYAAEILGLSRQLWQDVHDWSGFAMVGGVLLHLVLHWNWMVCMTRNLFRKPERARGARRRHRETGESCPVES